MKLTHLLAIALASGIAVAACAQDSTGNLSNDSRNSGRLNATDDADDDDDSAPATKTGSSSTTTSPADEGAPVNATPNSPEGKAFYIANVHPILSTKCGACHGPAGPGPNWFTSSDAEKSYAQLFQESYVVVGSRITAKGAHGGVTTNVLTATEIGTFNSWVAMEVKDGGNKATVNVLAELGTCFDQTLFNNMKMDTWQTTRRTDQNNTNKVTPWNENANNCTGCNNAPCSTCHSADAATNFVNAVGSPIFPKDYTFTESKKTNPAYISKYFGVGPDGKPVASNAIQKKSDATMKDKAYSHPMFKLTAAQQTAMTAFVNDVITKYTAGTCPGQTPPSTTTK